MTREVVLLLQGLSAFFRASEVVTVGTGEDACAEAELCVCTDGTVEVSVLLLGDFCA